MIRRERLRGIQRIARSILTGRSENIVVALVLLGETLLGKGEIDYQEQSNSTGSEQLQNQTPIFKIVGWSPGSSNTSRSYFV
jgi:hypothetical protein